MEPKHSKLGIASSCIAGAGSFVMVITFVIAGLLTAAGKTEDSLSMQVMGLFMLCVFGAMGAGAVMGIAAVCQPSVNRTWPVVGICVNVAAIVIFGGVVLLGMVVG